MKTLTLLSLSFLMVLASCKSEPKTSPTTEVSSERSIPELIAEAHGYQNWSSVKQITFMFNVDRDSTHFERSWVWKPKQNEITAISRTDTLSYNRKSMDSIAQKTNGGFINDRYWLLAPFNLMWDANNYTFEHTESDKAPISGESMQKLTIVYANEGGYTPGDAYDFYFKDDYIIREWTYRKANQEEPSLVTTWEDYVKINGMQISQSHKKADGSFHLYFTELKVED
ncbi:hypothetical protein EZV76_09940 [Flagellimonas alvinocaridis]|uniref:Selenophosphate synthetase n=1 Tax=Flagellimonas alvinocaridis TaxID=2530200 RepID=A0A4V4HX04_9FLAO|nr:hypothetical protein [Allomuricauda alvinocaridis]THV59146.1 hypothetical protein EZV76_09940 [Allomuricauda alvinocaridis]